METENIRFIGNMIEFAVQQEPFKTTPESRNAMEDLTLGSLVKAAIASNPHTRDVVVTVTADGGMVTIVGKAKTQEDVDLIDQMARTVPGVKEVRNEVTLNYRYQQIDT
jgi:osmotically-inducible protein OsmY